MEENGEAKWNVVAAFEKAKDQAEAKKKETAVKATETSNANMLTSVCSIKTTCIMKGACRVPGSELHTEKPKVFSLILLRVLAIWLIALYNYK